MLKNKVLIISVFLLLVCVGVLVNYTFFKPTKLNYFVASKIYKAPANSAFTDDNFYKCVVDAYNNENRKSVAYTENLTDEQLAKVSGIEKLTKLSSASLEGNLIENIDLSKNSELSYLYLTTNLISSIDLSKNSKLTTLELNDNKLTELDLSNLTALSTVKVTKNYITNINLSGVVNLWSLEIGFNNLTELDIDDNVKLASLDIGSCYWTYNYGNACYTISQPGHTVTLNQNNIETINLDNNLNLSTFKSYRNGLNNLDVSKNINLTHLLITGNELKTIDLSNNPNLSYINLSDNQLNTLTIGNNEKLKE